MNDHLISAPLATLGGHRPSAPEWFSSALAQLPERSWTPVAGARIETLTWGKVGLPGLLLLHGKLAHADWWGFIAPFFASTHRVTAMSWSGMGRSDWRTTYDNHVLVQEAHTVASATGLFESPQKPVVIAHSFGAFMSLLYAAQHGEKLAGVVTLDLPMLTREQREQQRARRIEPAPNALNPDNPGNTGVAPRSTRIYPTLPDALARFRFAPPQVCENLYIADHIARMSLKPMPQEGSDVPGWTWRFDPLAGMAVRIGNPVLSLTQANCPLAFMWGSESALVNRDVMLKVHSRTSPNSPLIEIPQARHHLMVDQPLAVVAALRALLSSWPASHAVSSASPTKP
jgi:pimeloyl-ACP methyl ester carboxylesterase